MLEQYAKLGVTALAVIALTSCAGSLRKEQHSGPSDQPFGTSYEYTARLADRVIAGDHQAAVRMVDLGLWEEMGHLRLEQHPGLIDRWFAERSLVSTASGPVPLAQVYADLVANWAVREPNSDPDGYLMRARRILENPVPVHPILRQDLIWLLRDGLAPDPVKADQFSPGLAAGVAGMRAAFVHTGDWLGLYYLAQNQVSQASEPEEKEAAAEESRHCWEKLVFAVEQKNVPAVAMNLWLSGPYQQLTPEDQRIWLERSLAAYARTSDQDYPESAEPARALAVSTNSPTGMFPLTSALPLAHRVKLLYWLGQFSTWDEEGVRQVLTAAAALGTGHGNDRISAYATLAGIGLTPRKERIGPLLDLAERSLAAGFEDIAALCLDPELAAGHFDRFANLCQQLARSPAWQESALRREVEALERAGLLPTEALRYHEKIVRLVDVAWANDRRSLARHYMLEGLGKLVPIRPDLATNLMGTLITRLEDEQGLIEHSHQVYAIQQWYRAISKDPERDLIEVCDGLTREMNPRLAMLRGFAGCTKDQRLGKLLQAIVERTPGHKRDSQWQQMIHSGMSVELARGIAVILSDGIKEGRKSGDDTRVFTLSGLIAKLLRACPGAKEIPIDQALLLDLQARALSFTDLARAFAYLDDVTVLRNQGRLPALGLDELPQLDQAALLAMKTGFPRYAALFLHHQAQVLRRGSPGQPPVDWQRVHDTAERMLANCSMAAQDVNLRHTALRLVSEAEVKLVTITGDPRAAVAALTSLAQALWPREAFNSLSVNHEALGLLIRHGLWSQAETKLAEIDLYHKNWNAGALPDDLITGLCILRGDLAMGGEGRPADWKEAERWYREAVGPQPPGIYQRLPEVFRKLGDCIVQRAVTEVDWKEAALCYAVQANMWPDGSLLQESLRRVLACLPHIEPDLVFAGSMMGLADRYRHHLEFHQLSEVVNLVAWVDTAVVKLRRPVQER